MTKPFKIMLNHSIFISYSQSAIVLIKELLKDLAILLTIYLSCSALSLIINYTSRNSLSLDYQSPSQRLEGVLSQLSASSEMPGELNEISLTGLREAIHNHVMILDARPHLLFQVGHIPTAINLSRDDFAHDYQAISRILEQRRSERIIVYCSDIDCDDSRLVARALKRLSFKDIFVFPGGWDEWTSAHLPEELK